MKWILGHWRAMLVASLIGYTILGYLVIDAHIRLAHESEARESAEMLMYYGSEGPFAVVAAPSGGGAQGPFLDAISPGEMFGYVNTACLRADTSMRGTLRMIHIGTGAEVTSSTFFVPAAERPCGPVFRMLQLPTFAPEGRYILLRDNVVLTPRGGPSQMQDLPPLFFTVRSLN